MKKVTLNRKELVEMYNKFSEMDKNIGSKNFKYFVFRNKFFLRDEAESIINSAKIEPSEEFKEFEKKRNDLAIRYCKKDEKGNPIYKNKEMGTVEIPPENISVLQYEINNLITEYSEPIKVQDDLIKDVERFLGETVEIELLPLPFSDFPSEGFDLEIFFPLIKEDYSELDTSF